MLRSAGLGCVSGLAGFGLGKAIAALAPRVVGAVSAADNLGGTLASCAINSFSADTPVETADGPRPIASLRVGDLVLAYDERTGSVGLYPITAVIAHEDETVLKLTLDGETLTTTPEHPFYVEDHGWVPAQALRAGVRVRRSDGGFGIVHALALERDPQRMYNLTVEGAHSYFVGEELFLVHNAGPCHGNSRASTVTSYLYLLRDRAGEVLKWGVSQNPARRYSQRELRTMGANKRPEIISSGTRSEMLDLERELVETLPGRLNHEGWAGVRYRSWWTAP